QPQPWSRSQDSVLTADSGASWLMARMFMVKGEASLRQVQSAMHTHSAPEPGIVWTVLPCQAPSKREEVASLSPLAAMPYRPPCLCAQVSDRPVGPECAKGGCYPWCPKP